MTARHRVTHGYVTVQTAVTHEGARAHVDIRLGALLPEDVPADEIAALLRQDRIELVKEAPSGGGGEGSGSGPEDIKPPARSAIKAAWVAYAKAVDPETGGIDGLTKEELIELYGKDGGDS